MVACPAKAMAEAVTEDWKEWRIAPKGRLSLQSQLGSVLETGCGTLEISLNAVPG
jgi:hypothetical protein